MHRCAPLPATVRRRGARRASWLMQLCPRCFRELRASETAWGTGWRARRARATHSRLDGSERSTVRGPAEKVRRFRASGSKNAPRFLATFIGSISRRTPREAAALRAWRTGRADYLPAHGHRPKQRGDSSRGGPGAGRWPLLRGGGDACGRKQTATGDSCASASAPPAHCSRGAPAAAVGQQQQGATRTNTVAACHGGCIGWMGHGAPVIVNATHQLRGQA
jgi:hypothetical protein